MFIAFQRRLAGIAVGIFALLLTACTTGTVTSTVAGTPISTSTPLPTATLSVAKQAATGTDATTAQLSATATCPSGTVMVGGGYHLTLAKMTQLVTISQDYPASANSWTATELNPQSGGTVTLTAYAACLTSSKTVAPTIASAASASDGTAVAACPTGTAILGGGFAQTANGANMIVASYPVTNTWHAMQTGQLHAQYTAYALCASSGLTAANISTQTVTVGNNLSGQATAACAVGQILIGGGYSPKDGAYVTITDDRPSDGLNSWLVSAANLYSPPTSGPGGPPPAPNPLQLTAYGICVAVM